MSWKSFVEVFCHVVISEAEYQEKESDQNPNQVSKFIPKFEAEKDPDIVCVDETEVDQVEFKN